MRDNKQHDKVYACRSGDIPLALNEALLRAPAAKDATPASGSCSICMRLFAKSWLWLLSSASCWTPACRYPSFADDVSNTGFILHLTVTGYWKHMQQNGSPTGGSRTMTFTWICQMSAWCLGQTCKSTSLIIHDKSNKDKNSLEGPWVRWHWRVAKGTGC